MKSSNFFVLAIIISVFAIAFYSIRSGTTIEEKYIQKIIKERQDKNKLFKFDLEESPIKDEDRNQFDSLNYYSIDYNMRIEADFVENPKQQFLEIDYTDGSKRRYLKLGYAHFNLSGIPQKLLILKPTVFVGEEYLFAPFYDETSANETYGGGRYLEPELIGEKQVLIDFNTAYNPYCAYNEKYNCPFPPKENQISAAVEAGEKIFELTH